MESSKTDVMIKALFEDAPDIVTLVDREGTILDINRTAPGYRIEEVVGSRFADYLTPEQTVLVSEALEKAVQTGAVQSYEVTLINPGGGISHWHNRVCPVQTEENITLLVVNGTDITERKQAEKALEESQKNLSLAQEIAHIGSWTYGVKTGELTWSDELFRIYGLTPRTQAPLQQTIEMIHPDDRRFAEETFRNVIRDGRPYEIEYRIIRPDGEERFIQSIGKAEMDEQGQVLSVYGTGQDISRHKQIEQALRESEERLRIAGMAAYDLIYEWDVASDSLEWFGDVDGLLGYEQGVISRNIEAWLGLIHTDDKAKLADAVELHRRSTEPIHYEYRVRHRDGTFRTWIDHALPLLDDQGLPCKWVGVCTDITERKQAEEDRVRLLEQLHQSQRMESVGRLAGGVAHDLNNLLSPIVGYGEMLMAGAVEKEAIKETLGEIVHAGMRARDLVHQLLAFSRKQPLEFKIIDLNALVRNFEKLLRRTIREDVAIHVDLSEPLPTIKGDAGQLEQVLMNLAVNAQDAMPDGGAFTIGTSPVDLDESYAAQHNDVIPGPYVMLAISDSGCGMDAQTREHIFEPFFTTKERSKGTGLGLATVYGIVKQHGGNIWVYSEPGRGTTFKVYLPVSDESLSPVGRTVETSSNLRGSETVLLVEDDEQVRDLARTILEKMGYTVLLAESGKEALSVLEAHDGPLHLLLTDVVMPGMNGRQLFERLSGTRPELKALYMSGYPGDVLAHRGVMDEGVHFLRKPFSIKALAIKVREVLDS